MSQRQEAGTAGRAGLADVARGSALNLAGAVISAAATLATTVIVTRHFSRAVAGAFVTATSLFLIVEAIAGLAQATARSTSSPACVPPVRRAGPPTEAASQQAQADLRRRPEPGRRRALRACRPVEPGCRRAPSAGPWVVRRTGRRRCRAARRAGPQRSSRTAQWRARTGGSRRSCGLRCGPCW